MGWAYSGHTLGAAATCQSLSLSVIARRGYGSDMDVWMRRVDGWAWSPWTDVAGLGCMWMDMDGRTDMDGVVLCSAMLAVLALLCSCELGWLLLCWVVSGYRD